MDKMSFFGLLFGVFAILGGNALHGGNVAVFLDPSAFLIVFCGTFAAAMVQTPAPVLRHLWSILPWIFYPPKLLLERDIQKVINWSLLVHRDGLESLEASIQEEDNEFARKGIELVAQGHSEDQIKDALLADIIAGENRNMQAVQVLDAMGGYAPTIGIIGAVLGLMHVLGNLSDPASIGGGIATAFVATIYGVGLANLALLPLAKKLEVIAMQITAAKEILLEGIGCVAAGDSAALISKKLDGYLNPSI